MINLGDFRTSSMIDFKFNTVFGTPSVPTTLATGTVLVYKSNSTTESSSTGITLTVDFDSVTGMHHVRIDTSANASFFTTASDFDVILTAGTVGGSSVAGSRLAHFSIENRSAIMPTTAGRTLLVAAGGQAAVDMTIAPTESYAAVGSIPTLAQFICQTTSMLAQFVIVSTTFSAYKVSDGASFTNVWGTFTLDSASNPTQIKRAT